MKKYILLLVIFIVNFSFSQEIDLEKIRKNITDSNSILFYDKLVKEFETQPSIFKSDSIKSQHLYYGKLYSSYYKKAAEVKSNYLKFIKLTSDKKYLKAIELGEDLLKKDPVNLVVIMNLVTCYRKIERDDVKVRLNELGVQAEVLLKTIANYGDGKNRESAFKVISIGDEFTLLNYLDIELDKYKRISENMKKDIILDIWVKDEKYKKDHRNKIYITVISKIPEKN